MKQADKKRKILFVMTKLHSGGGERVMVDLMNYLVSYGHTVYLMVMKKEGMYTAEISPEIITIDLNTNRFVGMFWKLVRFLKKERPDIIFSSYIHLNPLIIAANYLSRAKAKTVIRVGIPLSIVFKKFSSFKDKYILTFLTRILYRGADTIIAVSKGIADDVVFVTGVDRQIIEVFYSPKNIDSIRNRSEEYVPKIFNERTGPFILCVGRLVPQKDGQTLIEAFELFRQKNIGHLIIVGDGSERKRLEKLVSDKNISEYVSFEGNQNNPYAYMKNADVFVLSSRWEGLPNVLIEALICGVPIVATDCPYGSREIIAPETEYTNRLSDKIEIGSRGILVPISSPGLLADAIMSSLLNKKQKVKNVHNTFSFEEVMKKYTNIFYDKQKN